MTGLTAAQLADFDRDGYLVVEGVLTAAELAELEAEYAAVLDRVLPELASRGLLEDRGGSFEPPSSSRRPTPPPCSPCGWQ